MTPEETQAEMVSLQCYAALMGDRGGSSTLYVSWLSDSIKTDRAAHNLIVVILPRENKRDKLVDIARGEIGTAEPQETTNNLWYNQTFDRVSYLRTGARCSSLVPCAGRYDIHLPRCTSPWSHLKSGNVRRAFHTAKPGDIISLDWAKKPSVVDM
jgi:hypothetical protein